MTITQALKQLFESEDFKEQARINATLRNYLRRYRNGILGMESTVMLLQRFGYRIEVRRSRTQSA